MSTSRALKLGVPPWHLWGGEFNFDVNILSPLPTPQIAKVSYGRPETWTFLFTLELLALPDPPPSGSVQVHFDVTVGVGRTQTTLTDFVVLSLPFTTAPALAWASQAQEQGLPITITNPPFVETLPAEDIQVNARIQFGGTIGPGVHIPIRMCSYWSPRTHVREAWYAELFGLLRRGHP